MSIIKDIRDWYEASQTRRRDERANAILHEANRKAMRDAAAAEEKRRQEDWRVWGSSERFWTQNPGNKWTCSIHVNDSLKQAYLLDPKWIGDMWGNDTSTYRELDYDALIVLKQAVPTGRPFER